MVTALARIEGRAVGFIANNTMYMAGAITSDAGDKAARFLQLCDAFGVPVISLVDTPGMMVGPQAEATGLVRHTSRLLSPARRCGSRSSPSSCAGDTGSAHRRWRREVSTSRC